MEKLKIFVSSNQTEFQVERIKIKEFIENTPIYNNLFEVFIFEDVPAEGLSPQKIYLEEVKKSNIFIGLIGENYGSINENGVSASEEEFNTFLKTPNKQNIFMFILENINVDENTEKFISKVSKVTYGMFNKKNLILKIQKSLEKYLFKEGLIHNKNFDERFVLQSSYNDVSENKVKYFLKISDIDVEIGNIGTDIKNTLLNRLKVMNQKNELNNTGILFFSKDPEKFISQNEIRCVSFKGESKIDIMDKLFIKKTICEALKDVELFFNKNTKTSSEINGFRRKDIDEYPYEAIREGIINAIVHRDYNIKSSPITFFIFSDRIEITSPGELMPPLTLEELGEKTVHRNNKICELLQKTNYMEIIGSGIPRMREKMKQRNLPEPEFKESHGFFEVIFRNSKELDLHNFKLNDRQIQILKMMKKEMIDIDINKYMNIFKVSKSSASRDLKKLKELGLIKKQTNTKSRTKEYILNIVEQ
jgi:predicted HTH transcriptional regulator